MKPRRMAQETKDYIIRRTKDIAMKDMPPVLMRDAALDLTPQQRESYEMAEGDGLLRLGCRQPHRKMSKHGAWLAFDLRFACPETNAP